MLEDGHTAARVLISGRVRGVFFRDWTVENALALNLDGWVRNRSDGTVEALFVGKIDAVEKIIKLCWTGPISARVENIEVSKAMGITQKGFIQKPSINLHERRGD